MTLNESFRYVDDVLYCDGVEVVSIIQANGTPTYVYSLRRIAHNYDRLKAAFSSLDVHIHYSVKANASRAILRTLVKHGAGIDAVSGGEIFLALEAGARPEDVVFAGVGKTVEELQYALVQKVGWINVENVEECRIIDSIAASLGRVQKIALRLNPDVTASTHPYIATGHGGAKFGLTAQVVRDLLSGQQKYPHLELAGIHVHIGSQLQDVTATRRAVEQALAIVKDYPTVRTINIGGGFPVSYVTGQEYPEPPMFAHALAPLLEGYSVILEPGRLIVGDAGILLARVLYTKSQAGQTFYVIDGSMTELIRPALYQAVHTIVPLIQQVNHSELVQVVGPVCETADWLGHDVPLPPLKAGDGVAILTAGAYGSVMSSNYNARLRPAEVAVDETGEAFNLVRRRETFMDLVNRETSLDWMP